MSRSERVKKPTQKFLESEEEIFVKVPKEKKDKKERRPPIILPPLPPPHEEPIISEESTTIPAPPMPLGLGGGGPSVSGTGRQWVCDFRGEYVRRGGVYVGVWGREKRRLSSAASSFLSLYATMHHPTSLPLLLLLLLVQYESNDIQSLD